VRLEELACPRTKSRFTFSAALLLLTSGLALSQATLSAHRGATQPAQNTPSGDATQGVKPGRVYLTGENPVIRLLDKPGGAVLTFASYWRIVWSPAGPGHVCYLTTGDGKSPADLRVALTDNRKLYDYITENIMAPVLDQDIAGRPYTPVAATFDDPGRGTFTTNATGDSSTMTERRITARSNKYTVVLVWHDFLEPFQLDTPVGGAANPFGVTSLFIPAKTATVLINNKKAAGNVYPQMRGPAQSSTAFLAFSESWIK
jgi:hypothetical protein